MRLCVNEGNLHRPVNHLMFLEQCRPKEKHGVMPPTAQHVLAFGAVGALNEATGCVAYWKIYCEIRIL